jgi:hypothetical protein
MVNDCHRGSDQVGRRPVWAGCCPLKSSEMQKKYPDPGIFRNTYLANFVLGDKYIFRNGIFSMEPGGHYLGDFFAL